MDVVVPGRPLCDMAVGNVYIIASFVHLALFVGEVFLFAKCMSQKLATWLRCLAVILILTDTSVNFTVTYAVWQTCIIPSGAPPLQTRWQVFVGSITLCISGLCAHFYLVHRIYNMSKNLPLMLFLGVLTIASAGSHLAAAVQLLSNPLYMVIKTIPCDIKPTRAAWSLGLGLDIFVAITVVALLRRYDVVFTSTKSIVNKFLLCTVISGGLTAICGALVLALLSTAHSEFAIITLNFGKLHAITVFANLALIQGMQQTHTVVLHSHDISRFFAKHFGHNTSSVKAPTAVVVSTPSTDPPPVTEIKN